MNKTITMYELIGLIKDGNAPKKIKWEYRIYNLQSDRCYYCDETENIMEMDFLFKDLEDEVEILDEEDDFIDIEELHNLVSLDGNICCAPSKDEVIDKINQLIHNQKILIEKMKEKE